MHPSDEQDPLENQDNVQGSLARPDGGLFRGPPAYHPQTPWGPGLGLLVAVLIVSLSFAGAISFVLLGSGQAPMGLPGRKDASGMASSLNVFALWQVMVIVLTL